MLLDFEVQNDHRAWTIRAIASTLHIPEDSVTEATLLGHHTAYLIRIVALRTKRIIARHTPMTAGDLLRQIR